MTAKILSVFVAATATVALAAQGSTYYTDAVNGSNSNNGAKPSAAFKSISKAASVMQKNDTLIVLPGVYNLALEVSFPIAFGGGVDQSGITILAAEGPSKTFIDGGGSYAGIGMLRFLEKADGARFTGFTFRNMGDAYWSCAIRLGSTSGNAFRALNVEIDNCVFEKTLSRAFVVFGADATSKRQTTGLRIHNNLFLNTHVNRRCCAIYGDGVNHFYNNTIVHPTTTTNRAAVYLNALSSHGGTSKAVVKNNLILGGNSSTDNSWGIEKGPKVTGLAGGATAVVENNNCWGLKTPYANFVPTKTNLKVDPKTVSATDLRLQATSPCIDKGTTSVPTIRHDPDYFPGAFAGSIGKPRIPDIGAYERHDVDMALTIPPKLGGSIEFKFTGAAGLGGILVGLNEAAVPGLPFGTVLATPLFYVGTTSSPGSLKLPVPNVPTAEGDRLVFQGAYAGTRGLELINVRHTYLRK